MWLAVVRCPGRLFTAPNGTMGGPGGMPRSASALGLDSSSTPTKYASKRVVFVDDEAANGRLGLRYLLKLGVARDNITLLTNGGCKPLLLFLPLWRRHTVCNVVVIVSVGVLHNTRKTHWLSFTCAFLYVYHGRSRSHRLHSQRCPGRHHAARHQHAH